MGNKKKKAEERRRAVASMFGQGFGTSQQSMSSTAPRTSNAADLFKHGDKPEAKAHDSFREQIAESYNNSRLADIEIMVGGIVVPAHRLVLCLQSDYFSSALKDSFKEGQENVLSCEDGSEHAYLRMLQYLYRGDYVDSRSPLLDTEDDHNLVKHPRVYFLAKLCLLDSLKDVALLKFKATLEESWEDESLADCVREVFSNTSPDDIEMRAALVKTIASHSEQLQGFSSYRNLIAEGGDFAIDLVTELTRSLEESTKTANGSDKPTFKF